MVNQIVKQFPAFYRLNSILVLPSHLRLGLPRGLLSFKLAHQNRVHPNFAYNFTCLSHLTFIFVVRLSEFLQTANTN